MNPAEAFRRWALDPARTVEQLCALEVFLRWGRVVWGWKHKDPAPIDWPGTEAWKKERRENPAYRPTIDPQAVERTAEVWDQIDKWHAHNYDDRPLRNLDMLRFFPKLQEIGIENAEIADLSPLTDLKELKTVRLLEPFGQGGFVTVNLDAIAGVGTLESLALRLRAPWPNLSALGNLASLRTLQFRGNLLALAEVKALPQLRSAQLDEDTVYRTPIRSFEQFPAMPKLERLAVPSVADLRGLEAFEHVRNLDLGGPFDDLTPIGALKKLTYLRVTGERFMDLTPLAQLPNLRELVIVRERPLDVAPLSESPSLREVTVQNCPILATEVAALNAGLLPWGPDFLAQEPRSLAALKVLNYRPDDPDLKALRPSEPEETERQKTYQGDTALAHAEHRWFARELQRRLNTLLGIGWHPDQTIYASSPGHYHVTIQRYRDVVRMGEIIHTLRELLASTRFPWRLMLSVQPHGDLSEDMDEIRAQKDESNKLWWDRELDLQEEREDHEEFLRHKRELYERFEREHRLRLLEQQGAEIDPKEFSPGAAAPAAGSKPAAPAPKNDDDDDFDDEDEDYFDDEEDEDLDMLEDEDDSQLAQDLSFVVSLDEEVLWITDHMRENAEYTLGLKATDWHSLPEPPEKRPRPW